MGRICHQCQAQFEVTPDDLAFLDKISPVFNGKKYSIPPPLLCPNCRQQRRAAQINEIYLHRRTCDFTGKEMVSNFHPSSPYTVYEQEVFYSDVWDPLEFGREFDFSRPFFEQFSELSLAVPHPSLFTGYQYDENCDYTNYSGRNRNCYLIFDSDENQDCYYCYSINGSRNCMDCYRARRSELCFECTDCVQCYHSMGLQDCENCSDSAFLKNCIGCKRCLMCSNLRNKEYHIENKPVSKETFGQAFTTTLGSRVNFESARMHFAEFTRTFPQKPMHGTQNEDVSGDYLIQCKHAHYAFDSEEVWDGTYVFQGFMPVKDVMDVHESGEAELLYECSVGGYKAHHVLFSANYLANASDLLYCTYCLRSSNLFGCVSLDRKKYCVLNKQYSKEEYEELVAKIIEHMKAHSEYGEFFPVTLSPFAYNESMAQDYVPLSKEEVLKRGWAWRDPDLKEYLPSSVSVPDAIEHTPDSIVGKVLACSKCQRNYKLLKQELALLRQMHVPVSPLCFYCRHEQRQKMRNPRVIYDRTCQKCGEEMQTTYAPDRPEIVYCERCYLETVY